MNSAQVRAPPVRSAPVAASSAMVSTGEISSRPGVFGEKPLKFMRKLLKIHLHIMIIIMIGLSLKLEIFNPRRLWHCTVPVCISDIKLIYIISIEEVKD